MNRVRYISSSLLTSVMLAALATFAGQPLAAQDKAVQETQPSALQKSLVGAWVLAGSPDNPEEPAADAEIKFWGLGHFAVTKRNADTGDIAYHHVGTYTLDGDQYAETITHAIGDTLDLVGETFKFRIEVDGDTYIQHGIGNPWTQQWNRLKSAAGPSPTRKSPAEQNAELFAVPTEASTDELFKFMDQARTIRPKTAPGVMLNMREHALNVYGAVVKAADVVLAREISDEDMVKALSKKLEALSALTNLDPSRAAEVQAIIDKYSEDERPAIAALAVGQALRTKASDLRTASESEAQDISQQVLDYLDRFGLNKSTYPAVATVASGLGYSKHPELAADFHEKISNYFRDAEDASFQRYADRMLGTARRLRLLGNTMDLSGTIGDGSQFKWDDYRGQVVLVDFWASWCGPCLAELPNMKRNLELYGDKGFAIVGINMDSTRAAFEKGVKQHDISWANIFIEEQGQTGWDAPMATHYGISGIPTAILVDQQGKVVSLRARGQELDRQLEDLLGAPAPDTEKAKDKDDADTEDSQDNEGATDKS